MAHVSEAKKEIVKRFSELIREYPIVGSVNMENLPAPQLQTMREQLRDKVVMLMGKRRLMEIAINDCKDKENIEEITPYLKGMPALIFTKENPFTLYKTLQKRKSPAPAKAGQTAPKDIVIPAGPTGFSPGPVIGELGSLGIKAGVEGGKVAVKEDAVVVKEGDTISQKVAGILTRMEIKPMEVGLDLVAVYEEGNILTKDVLAVDEDEIIAQFVQAQKWAFNLTMEAAYPTKETTELLLTKAHEDALKLSVEQNVVNKDNIDLVLAKSERIASALKTQLNV